MTTDQLIDGIIEREGGYTDDPKDHGGATNFGITAQAWGLYKGLNRQATRDEVKAITREQAVAFYRVQYIDRSPFRSVAYEPLRVALIDFAVNSGTPRAIRWLQRVLDVPVTGAFDDRTVGALSRDRGPLVNRALAAARLYMIDQATDHGDIDKKFEEGLESRALSLAEFSVNAPKEALKA